MNWMMTKRKFSVACRRNVNRFKRKFRRPPGQAISEKRKAINLDNEDFVKVFNPKLCFMLTIWASKTKAHMAPVKWITEIRVAPYKIAMALFEGGEAERLIRKAKAFTISPMGIKSAKDFYRLIKILPDTGTITAMGKFRAEPAFFIKGFKVNKQPWIECKLEKIYRVDRKTVIVVGKIVHISKLQHSIKEKLMHYRENLFINTKTMGAKTPEKL